jgi:SAM-dependent methyltransferase
MGPVPTPRQESVSFDRAAGYYDATRSLPAEVARAQTALLLDELGPPGRPVLEIGVGTGRVALPLAERHRVVGIDLSREMLRVLAAKEADVLAVEGDALRLPFRSGTFAAVVACHVLHLVRDWRRAVDEVRRVLTPGGLLLASRGSRREGLGNELALRIRDVTGMSEAFVGLDDLDELDDLLVADGWAVRHPEPIPRPSTATVADYFDGVEANCFSWTWPLTDEQRATAVRQVRAWVVEQYGDPAETPLPHPPVSWHVYRRP